MKFGFHKSPCCRSDINFKVSTYDYFSRVHIVELLPLLQWLRHPKGFLLSSARGHQCKDSSKAFHQRHSKLKDQLLLLQRAHSVKTAKVWLNAVRLHATTLHLPHFHPLVNFVAKLLTAPGIVHLHLDPRKVDLSRM